MEMPQTERTLTTTTRGLQTVVRIRTLCRMHTANIYMELTSMLDTMQETFISFNFATCPGDRYYY